MDPVVLIAILIGSLVILGLFINRKLSDLTQKQNIPPELLEIVKVLQSRSDSDRKALLDSLHKNSRDMNERLDLNTQALNQRLDRAAKVIGEVQRSVGEMSEVGKGIRTLQEFLQSPKLRGGLGEEVLKEMIGQTFPKNAFHLQYSFKSGMKVDAVLKTSLDFASKSLPSKERSSTCKCAYKVFGETGYTLKLLAKLLNSTILTTS